MSSRQKTGQNGKELRSSCRYAADLIVIEESHIRTFSLGNLHDRRDQPAQIDLRVQLDSRVTPSIVRPRKDRETEVDDRGVECVDRVGQRDGERLVDVEGPRGANEALREVGVDAPIAGLVRLGQRRLARRARGCPRDRAWAVPREDTPRYL